MPRQGVYCVSAIDPQTKKTINKFAETLDDLVVEVEKFKNRQQNVYVALGSFDGFSRKAEHCIFYRSFFIDLDVGQEKADQGKGYATKEEALSALDKFLEQTELPPPVRLDSGTGIHAYWLLDEEVPIEEYLPYAEKFKAYCLERIYADPAVMADASRIMRCPESLNYKTDPPSPAFLIDTELCQYDFAAFKDFLGEAEKPVNDIIASLPKGLDEETRKMLKMDNFSFSFEALAEKSFGGSGCAQVLHALENEKTVGRDLWAGVLTIAVHCEDGDEAIHKMSSEHPDYNYEATEKTARSFNAPRTCDWFADNFPERCQGCPHRGKIKTPIVLGRKFQPAQARKETEESVWKAPDSKDFLELPGALTPFVRGVNGGIYYVPAPKKDRKGVVHESDPQLVSAYDLYPTKRMYSPIDGECLTMRLILPNDEPREFLLPMKAAYASDKLKDITASNGVLCAPTALPHLMNYVVKWGQYMVSTVKADIMRMQMGWTESETAEIFKGGFVIGNTEIRKTGIVECASSPYVKGLAKFLKPQGSYEKWQEAANKLNLPSLELHAFTMLCGFGSPLMQLMSTSGVVVSLLGRSGAAKTGAMYAGLSIFGNPKELSVYEATDNGLVMRFVNMRSLMFGLDEVGNKDSKVLSHVTHNISHGKAKIRLQGTVNAEREHAMSAALIGVYTTNESVYSKFELDKAAPDGEAARVVEFLLRKPDILQKEGGGALGRAIFDTFRHNYGYAGPIYIQELFKLDLESILARIEYWRDRFTAMFGEDGTYRFYENLVAAVFTGGEIAMNAKIIDIDLDRVFTHVVKEMIMIRDKVVKINKLDYETLLGDFLNENLGSLLVIKESKVVMEPRFSIVGRLSSDEGTIAISKSVFDKWLNKRNVSAREFEVNMKEKGVLQHVKVGRLATGWKHAPSNTSCTNYYFKSDLPTELITHEDETHANTGT